MTTPTNQTGLIKPFNLDHDNYCVMFDEPSASNIAMVVYLYYASASFDEETGTDTPKLWQDTRAAILAFAKFGSTFVEPPIIIGLAHGEDLPLGFYVSRSMRDTSKKWYCYPQVGFYNPALLGKLSPPYTLLHEALHTAMNFLAELWEITGTHEPSRHQAVTVDCNLAERYGDTVSIAYEKRIGVWHRELVEPCNRFMVMWYAVERGLDPISEYGRFLDAGCKFYPEYLNLPA